MRYHCGSPQVKIVNSRTRSSLAVRRFTSQPLCTAVVGPVALRFTEALVVATMMLSANSEHQLCFAETDKTERGQASRASPPAHTQRRPCLTGEDPIKVSTDVAPQGVRYPRSSQLPGDLSGGPPLLAKRAPALRPLTLCSAHPYAQVGSWKAPTAPFFKIVLQRCCHSPS